MPTTSAGANGADKKKKKKKRNETPQEKRARMKLSKAKKNSGATAAAPQPDRAPVHPAQAQQEARLKEAKKQREMHIGDAVANMQDQNVAAGRTAPLLKEFKKMQLQVYSANDMQKLLKRQRRYASWWNQSAYRYNTIFKAPGAPPVRYFEESAEGGAEILALCARHRVAGTPHPSWLQEFMGLKMGFNFMWTMFIMTSLPDDITPEMIVTRKF
jgi:hypothetical protein